MKKLFLFLLLPALLSAQYSKNDSDLVKTTYQRRFDKKIIGKYLNSDNEIKRIAALLSIGNSSDTSFVPDVENCNLNSHKDLIPFTLGQLGRAFNSTHFLLKNISEKNSSFSKRSLFDAIGKTASLSDYRELISDYFKGDSKNFDGISLAIANFYARGITFDKDTLDSIFSEEFQNYEMDSSRYLDALYALYRVGGSKKVEKLLIEGLKHYLGTKASNNLQIENIIQYSFGCLRKVKFFPDDSLLLNKLAENKDWLIREEASKVICYYSFKTKDEIEIFLKLLRDHNPNVSRQAAISLKEFNLNKSLLNYVRNYLDNEIDNLKLTTNTRGEIFLSYVKLFPSGFPSGISLFKNKVEKEFIYKAYGFFPENEFALNSLCKEFYLAKTKDRITILEQLINFQKNFQGDKSLKKILFTSLSSGSPALVSISADGLIPESIKKNKNEIKNIIAAQINKYLNNADFQESIMSLTGLSEKIDSSYCQLVFNSVENSKLYSLQKYAAIKKGLNLKFAKNSDNFDTFWNDAFKYKYAVVKTVKGEFKIIFLPSVAPISVGNFCYLTEKKFFDGLNFHRVVPGFVIQGGDPLGTGWGGPGYEIISEFSDISFNIGKVGMASAGKDTEGSQWFVMQGYYPHLDGRYTVFGKVIDGIETVFRTDQYDKILSIKLISH